MHVDMGHEKSMCLTVAGGFASCIWQNLCSYVKHKSDFTIEQLSTLCTTLHAVCWGTHSVGNSLTWYNNMGGGGTFVSMNIVRCKNLLLNACATVISYYGLYMSIAT